ncbi:class I mannose-6-phosphate isomerase [Phaeacidiphilus oryzae]|uniref:class I mannose-6-phosphate isomerase n=1 Tax=Phaeacidiphilus oryzae TaxID=348818 RepID=UPI000AA3416D|nr:class I mannose-6-phosphate isomerase [Phaeacidiphilus oryzae]
MHHDGSGLPYQPNPRYAAVGGAVARGWPAALAELPERVRVVALDGPWALDWDGVRAALAAARPGLALLDVRPHLAPWAEIEARTEAGALAHDPHFAALSQATLADFFTALPAVRPGEELTVVYGPGAALVEHDALWYADLPKRYAEAAIAAGTGTNLGQRPSDGPGGTRRLFYIDWPILDRHRDSLADRIDRWIDLQDPDAPASLDGAALRATAAGLARRPFRTRPTFNTTPWGGQWGRRELGFNPEGPNTALGYELIAPESGVLIGGRPGAGTGAGEGGGEGEGSEDSGPQIELPFQLLVALHPELVLGETVHEMFGTSFPIRFDYLDTVDGGNLSVHCHPQPDYMKEVFGWPYTQHETYYLMSGSEQNTVFLGLRDDADVSEFHHRAHAADAEGTPFPIERFVQTFPATPHQLFLIPGGTPHGSGAGNVVLEVSATPYLYSLRFYDWLRRDARNRQRAVHVEHAFRNLDTERTGDAVARDLVQSPRILRKGEGWREEVLGRLPEMFFVVHRLAVDAQATAPDRTDGRFHVVNVVEGDGVLVRTEAGVEHRVGYAETLVVPAAVGRYTVTGLGARESRVVKAFVK